MTTPTPFPPSFVHPDLAPFAGSDVTWVTWYHASCQDGSTSAAVVSLAAEALGLAPDQLLFHSVQYGRDVPDLEALEALIAAGRRLVLHVVDFSWEAPVLGALSEAAVRSGGLFRCLDHHDSALRKLQDADIPGLILDMNRSGARLAWDHCFRPEVPVPQLVLAVEDADLWRWRLKPLSRQVWDLFGLTSWHTAPDWPVLKQFLRELPVIPLPQTRSWAESGAPALLAVADDQLRRACKSAVSDAHGLLLKDQEGRDVLFAAACSTTHRSDVGHALCEAFPGSAAAVWRMGSAGQVLVSLRAPDPSHAVNRVAEVYGGGGHPAAAAFSMEWSAFSAAFKAQPPPQSSDLHQEPSS